MYKMSFIRHLKNSPLGAPTSEQLDGIRLKRTLFSNPGLGPVNLGGARLENWETTNAVTDVNGLNEKGGREKFRCEKTNSRQEFINCRVCLSTRRDKTLNLQNAGAPFRTIDSIDQVSSDLDVPQNAIVLPEKNGPRQNLPNAS